MPDLPSDQEQLSRMLMERLSSNEQTPTTGVELAFGRELDRQVSATPHSRNRTAGLQVKDWEDQNYRNTDPSAGTGDGAVSEPKKIEVI